MLEEYQYKVNISLAIIPIIKARKKHTTSKPELQGIYSYKRGLISSMLIWFLSKCNLFQSLKVVMNCMLGTGEQ